MVITVKANELKQNNGATIGIANINFGDKLKIRNVTIKNSDKGRFIGMPNYMTNKVTEEGKPIYQDVFNPISKEGRQKLYDAIFDAFDSGMEIRIKDASDKITAQMHALENNGNGTIGIGKLYVSDDYVINNITVKLGKDREGNENEFVAYPSYKSNEVDENGKAVYKNFAYPANAEVRAELNKMILDTYHEARELKDSREKEEVTEEKVAEKPKKGVKAKLKDGEGKKKSVESTKDKSPKKDLEMAM